MSRMEGGGAGKSPRISSTPGRPSPRKLPLYSPSERSPFSFNEDTLKILATDIEQQNGLIPLNIPLANTNVSGKCFSQPQTPSEERRPFLQESFSTRRVPTSPLNSNSSFFSPINNNSQPGLSHSHSFGSQLSSFGSSHLSQPHGASQLSQSVGASNIGTPGKSVRDYEDSFKETKKENFNLKLRIFFLEERLGQGRKTPADELANANLELKIQLESCKHDLAEKNSLLSEASEALDSLEKQVDTQKQIIKNYEEGSIFELGNVPKSKKLSSRSPDVSRKPLMSPKFGHKNLFFIGDDLKSNNNLTKDNVLSILKEDEEMCEHDTKCKEYKEKIKQLEESLTLSRQTQQKLSESLERSQSELAEMSKKMSNKSPFQLEIDMSSLAGQEIKLECRRDCSVQTITDSDNIAQCSDQLVEECQGLKSENRKIRDQLKLQVQERKLLLKKISMLKEQLGSLSETEHKSFPSSEHLRPPTSCADIGTQCDIIDEDEKQASLDNPLSDCSTWNTELPNIADVQLCSSPELMFDCDKHFKGDVIPDQSEHSINQPIRSKHFKGDDGALLEHLSQQLESSKSDLAAKMDYIATLEDDLAVKNDVIKEQNETINDYREEILRMEDSMYGCPVMDHQQRQRRLSRRHRKRKTPRSLMMQCPKDSVDSDEWSEPETGVSIARIGLPNSYPELTGVCSCDKSSLFSDCDEKTRLGDVECSSSMCLASGARVLEGLISSLLHQVDSLKHLDSGIDTEEDEADIRESLELFRLCSGCTSSIPTEFDDLLKTTHLGLSSAVKQLENVKRKMNKIVNVNKQLKLKDKDDCFKAEEAKTRLNENYILIAKLSSENLRLLGEQSKLETSIEDLEKSLADNELRLQSEICALKGKLLDKEKEVERLQMKIVDFDRKSAEMGKKFEQLQEKLNLLNKMSPDTSASSFDFYSPTAASSQQASTGSYASEGFRPRAFSAVSSGSSHHYKMTSREKDPKLCEVSSPDLGVDLRMESDMYSSLERGNTSRVGSLAFEKIVQENRALRHEREVLNQKLGRSKSALQETLLRLSRSNMAKVDQMGSPSVQRRGLTPSRSQGGLASSSRSMTSERELSLFGNKPK